MTIKKSMYELSASAIRIANLFFDFPTKEFTLNETCASTGTSKTTAKKIVESFIQQGLITRKTIGKLWLLSANTKSKSFIRSKIVHNLGLILHVGFTGNTLIDFIRQRYPQAKSIILFGSYRKGDNTETSDLDIAVEVAGNKDLEIVKFTSFNLGYRKNVLVNIHLFARKNVNLNVFSNIANGIVLDGFLEVKP